MNKAYKFSKNFFDADQNSSAALTIILGIITIITKISGLIYQILINNLLGTASSDRNIFNTALIIPDLLSNILMLGAVSSAVIPIMNKIRAAEGEQRYYDSFVLGLQTFFSIHFVFAISTMIFTPQIINLLVNITHNNTLSPEDIQVVVLVTRVLVFPQVLLSISTYISAALQTLNRFIVPYIASLVYNIIQILGLVLLYPVFGEKIIWPLVIGTLGAYVLHLLVQFPLLKTTGFWVSLKKNFFQFKNLYKERFLVKNFILQSLPRMLALSADIGLMKIFFLIAGSLSLSETIATASGARLNTTLSLIAVPFSLFVNPYVQLAFPKLAKYFADQKLHEAKDVFLKTVQKTLFYIIPLSAILIVLNVQIVRLTFGVFPFKASKLTWEDTNVIAILLACFTLGLMFESIIPICQRLFFAAHKNRYTLIISIAYLIFAFVFAKIFSNLLSHATIYNLSSIDYTNISNYLTLDTDSTSQIAVAGIGLGISFANFLTFIIYYFATKNLIEFTHSEFLGNILKKLFAGIFMGIFMYLLTIFWENNISQTQTIWGLLSFTFIIVSLGLVVYYLSSLFFKVEEIYYFKSKITKFIFST